MKAIFAIALLAVAMLCATALAGEKNAESWMKNGFELSKNGSYKEAVQAFGVATQIEPGNKAAWINKATALDRLKEHDEAISSYMKALEILNKTLQADPQNSTIWTEKGLLLHNVDLPEEAVKAFDNATNFDPKNEMAWKMSGVILASELHRYNEAIEAFDSALQIEPNDAQVWSLKGDALKASGRQAEADAAYANAKELGGQG